MSNKLLCGCEDMCKGHEGSLLQVRIMTDISTAEFFALDALVEACDNLRETLVLPWQGKYMTDLETGVVRALAAVEKVRENEAKRS